MTEREAVAMALRTAWWRHQCTKDVSTEWELLDASGKAPWLAEVDAAIAALTAHGWQKVGPDQVVDDNNVMKLALEWIADNAQSPLVVARARYALNSVARAMIEARPK